MAYWVQKAQITKYLGAFHHNRLGLQAKLGPLRHSPGLSPYKPMISPSAASQTKFVHVWEMKQSGEHIPGTGTLLH